jgi:hypothetical protein
MTLIVYITVDSLSHLSISIPDKTKNREKEKA